VKAGLEEAAVEAKVNDFAGGNVPAVDAEVEGAIARIAAGLAAF